MDITSHLNEFLQQLKRDKLITMKDVSDGYHTFRDLYNHRIELFLAVCRSHEDSCWRSKLHSDGTMFEDSFVLGIFKSPGHQITYHLNISRWDEAAFAETLYNAPEFDGHTPEDVIERLKKI